MGLFVIFVFSVLLVNFSIPGPIPYINYYSLLISLKIEGQVPQPYYLGYSWVDALTYKF